MLDTPSLGLGISDYTITWDFQLWLLHMTSFRHPLAGATYTFFSGLISMGFVGLTEYILSTLSPRPYTSIGCRFTCHPRHF